MTKTAKATKRPNLKPPARIKGQAALNRSVNRFVHNLIEASQLIEGPACAAVYYKAENYKTGMVFLGTILRNEEAAELAKLLEQTAKDFLCSRYGPESGTIMPEGANTAKPN